VDAKPQAAPRIGWTHVVIVVIVLPLALFFGRAATRDAEGGALVCDRSRNQCEIENGWLIRDRVAFPADELEGATLERYVHVNRPIYTVRVKTRHGSFKLGGTDKPERNEVVAAITKFAHDPQAPALDVRVSADRFQYGIVGFLALIYAFVFVAFTAAFVRQRVIKS